MCKGEEGDADGLGGVAEMVTKLSQNVPTRIGEEPKLEILPSDHRSDRSRGGGHAIQKKARYAPTAKAYNEIIMHTERRGSHIG
jgi:hypothetical protein